MRNLKCAFTSVFLAAAITGAFALDLPENTQLSITTDVAFAPKTDFVAGGDHFAPVTGFYGGFEARATGRFSYTIFTPLGESFLLNSATVNLAATLELTPITVLPGIEVTFTPLPFLVFSAGTGIGTGWSIGSLYGTAFYNGDGTYTPYSAFSRWYSKSWAQAVFQFDTGAIFSGDWTHVVMLCSYKVYYHTLLGEDDSSLWMWQNGANLKNGFEQYMQAVLAYQMPLALKRAGVMFEMEGYLPDGFTALSLSPLLQFEIGSHNSLALLFTFSSRQSFKENHSSVREEPMLTPQGREWFFKRIALSYTYSF